MAVPRRAKRSSVDRFGRQLGERNAQGLAYEVCVMCGHRAMVRARVANDTIWRCESCGYADSERRGPLV